MKILLDSCVWGCARDLIAEVGHDVVWSGDWPRDPGDRDILEQAHAESRILVTLDKDFGELAILHDFPHHGILRLVGIPARQQAAVCLRILGLHGENLLAGAIITCEPGRLRIRMPEK